MSDKKPTFNNLINESEVPVLVDFFAEWCGPCKVMAPMLAQFANEMEGRVKVLKVDVDRNPSASQQYQISAVPTLILFHKGKIKWRKAGIAQPHELKKVLEGVG